MNRLSKQEVKEIEAIINATGGKWWDCLAKDDVQKLIETIKYQQKEIEKLINKNDRLEQQYMILKGSHDLFSKANSHNHFDE